MQYNNDGTLNFVGRKDSQIKLRGQRLELGEIEYQLWADQHVQNAMVMLSSSGVCQQRLVAVVTLSGLASADENDVEHDEIDTSEQNRLKLICQSQMGVAASKVGEIRDYLMEKLPVYMVPTLWFAVESIPLGSTGKMDRKKVEEWISSMSQTTFEQGITGDDDEADGGEE